MKKIMIFLTLLIVVATVGISKQSLEFYDSDGKKSNTQRVSETLYNLNNYEINASESGFIASNPNGNMVTQDFNNEKVKKVTYTNNQSLNSNKKMSMRKGGLNSYLIENSYEYDDNNNLIQLKNNNKIFSFDFDNNSNFISGKIDGIERYKNVYDGDNNLVKTIFKSGDIKE